MLFKIESFMDETGRAVSRKTPESPAIGKPEFFSNGQQPLGDGRTLNFYFPIAANSLEEAFANMADACNAAGMDAAEKFHQQEQEKRNRLNGVGTLQLAK